MQFVSLEENWRKKLLFTTIFYLQKTFATKNCLVTLNKLHKTLVASVDEINGHKTLHHLYIIVCHMYITKKISNLHSDTWQMKNV